MESAPGIDEEGWISIITDITAGKEAGPISVEVRKSDYHAYKQSSSATLLPTFTYSPTLVLPEELQLLVEEHLKDAACDCSPGQNCLSDPECSCVNTYGCFYNQDQRLMRRILPDRAVLHECNRYCGCAGACQNLVVQTRVSQLMCVRWVPAKGFGLYTTAAITEGQFLCLYAGDIISSAEAARRWQEQRNAQSDNFILVIRESSQDGSALRTIVDPTRVGNIGRFLNHACPPLTTHTMLIVRPVGSVVPYPALFAVRNIEAGEELTWDYGELGLSNKKCLCGSERCRGYLPSHPDLS